MAYLEIQNLSVTYCQGGIHAVRDCNLQLNRGETLGIVGESGSGKSTLALALLRMFSPKTAEISGNVMLEGREVLNLPQKEFDKIRWQEMAMVFQKSMNSFSPVHRLGRQLENIWRVHEPKAPRKEIREKLLKLFEICNLKPEVYRMYPFELSGGMLQRVSIVMALMHNPGVLVLDEATTALDVLTQQQIMAELKQLQKRFQFSLQVNPFGPAQLNDAQREALFYAINGDEVIMGAYGSTELAQNPNSLLVPDQALYSANTADYVYDLEKAKTLAEESGLAGMTLTYIYNADRANMEAVAVVLQAQLAQIGVNLKIEGMDSTSFFQRFFAASSYGFNGQEVTWDLGTNGWDSMRGTTLYQAYSYLNQKDNAWGLTPTCGELTVKVNTTTDMAEAKALAEELVELAMAQHRIYPLTYTNYVMVAQKYVTGLDKCPIVPEFADWLAISVNG